MLNCKRFGRWIDVRYIYVITSMFPSQSEVVSSYHGIFTLGHHTSSYKKLFLSPFYKQVFCTRIWKYVIQGCHFYQIWELDIYQKLYSCHEMSFVVHKLKTSFCNKFNEDPYLSARHNARKGHFSVFSREFWDNWE